MPLIRAMQARFLPLLACALLIGACSKRAPDHQVTTAVEQGRTTPEGDGGSIAGAAVADLTEAQLIERSRAALEGSASAAFQVMMYYEMAVLDRRNAEYWAQIAAEIGGAIAMERYAGYLMDVADVDRCRRAAFWMKRAMDAAPEDATRLATSAERMKEKCTQL